LCLGMIPLLYAVVKCLIPTFSHIAKIGEIKKNNNDLLGRCRKCTCVPLLPAYRKRASLIDYSQINLILNGYYH
jgi:hypothetical protein